MNKTIKAFMRPFRLALSALNPFRWGARAWLMLRNRLRRRAKMDYVLLSLPAVLPALPEQRGFLQRRLLGGGAFSLWELAALFKRIADDPRPKGVVLILRGFEMSLADLQTLRAHIVTLRESGKRVIAYAQSYDLPTYFIASAADEIIVQPGGELATVGLAQQVTFFKDALESIGVAFDAVAISPYKGFFDSLTRSEISPEGREQLEWLLDSRFAQYVETIAQGRHTTAESVRAMIDASPLSATDALSHGYVDAVMTEESLPAHLNAEHLITQARAARVLLRRARKKHVKYIAVLPLSGLMVSGEGRRGPPIPLPVPLLDEPLLGDVDVVSTVRRLAQDDNAAAVVLFIDSGGGAASAAEAMTSALESLAKTRPIIVYMNSVAASGGYYVATAGHWIVAQPGTITGSIGVTLGKPVTDGLFERLKVNRYDFTRGRNVNILSDRVPFDETQRGIMRHLIEQDYALFVQRVADARGMTPEAVDAVGGGRVWTGEQALTHGLVDALGGFELALKRARDDAHLPDHAPIVVIAPSGYELPPQPAKAIEEANPAAGLTHAQDIVRRVFNARAQFLMPFKLK